IFSRYKGADVLEVEEIFGESQFRMLTTLARHCSEGNRTLFDSESHRRADLLQIAENNATDAARRRQRAPALEIPIGEYTKPEWADSRASRRTPPALQSAPAVEREPEVVREPAPPVEVLRHAVLALLREWRRLARQAGAGWQAEQLRQAIWAE